MNPIAHAAWHGVSRGWREFKHALANVQELAFNLFFSVVTLILLIFERGVTIPGTSITLGMATLPGMLGFMLALGGTVGAVGALAAEREDGTLLRAKAVPYGMVGYLVGRIVSVSLGTVLGLVIVLVPSLFLLPELVRAGTGWLTVAWVVVLGLLATLPWGAVIGSLARSPQGAAGMSMLVLGGISAVSGVFYPLAALPGWLQMVGQVFPVYWTGLGMRSALLGDTAMFAEVGQSWRTPWTVGVLVLWAVAGLVLAPPILRRMARRESGSAMEARRERAMRRIG